MVVDENACGAINPLSTHKEAKEKSN